MGVEQPPKTKTSDGNGDIVDTGTGSSGTDTPSPSTIYFGYCIGSPSHKGDWTGPERTVQLDADYDCRDHNVQCEAQGAHIVSRPII
jgi:hypothetical protein